MKILNKIWGVSLLALLLIVAAPHISYRHRMNTFLSRTFMTNWRLTVPGLATPNMGMFGSRMLPRTLGPTKPGGTGY
jgi:hypothetical protein